MIERWLQQVFLVYKHMCGYFCIGFIDFMLKGESLTDFINLFSSDNFKQNDDLILKYFKSGWDTWYISKFK